MRQREEDLKWGVENTWHRINEPVGPKWHHDIVLKLASWWMWTLIHIAWQKAFCRCFFWLATVTTVSSTRADFPRITVASHVAAAAAKALKSRRSMYCPAQCALQQAPCVHPWAQTAINWSNSATDVTEVTGGMEILTQLYTQQQSRQQKTSSCRVFSFKLARVFLQISGQSTRHTGNVKTSQWCEEAYHQYPTRLLPT